MASSRRPVYFNSEAASWTAPAAPDATLINDFHKTLPDYAPTRLVSIDALAKELGVGAVYIKDESSRFGLPAFKILGASWGVFRALTETVGLPMTSSIDDVKEAFASNKMPVKVFAATEGNFGRAVARMGGLLGVHVEIHVPGKMEPSTVEFIEGEGATVLRANGPYEIAMKNAHEGSLRTEGGILVQDTAFEGYEDIPGWIVDGYSSMLKEIDEQLGDTKPDLAISPVGVGSLAQAVVAHFKGEGRKTAVATVEPDTAPCLWKSLSKGQTVSVDTTGTIMAGLDCGEVSTISWPYMKSGVDASLTVSDYESHVASLDLQKLGVNAGPCGASGLAALRRMSAEEKTKLGLKSDSVIVLLCTEGQSKYEVPFDVSTSDPIALTQTLVQIDSSSPDLGSVPGPGETAVAKYIKGWLEHRDIESHWVEPTKGRPSVVGVVRGSGGGKSLMLNGHIDTVTLLGYDDNPLSGKIQDSKLYGRGAADMKCGVAAQMVALAKAKGMNLKGDVIFTGVADEEALSIGTEQVLEAGWRADAAIVSEPTNLEIVHAHKGFVWVEVDIHGVAAHGSRADLGVDAICKAGHFLVELETYAKRLSERTPDPAVGTASVHASLVKGGEEASSYPALCTVTLERRTVSGETPDVVETEIRELLDNLAAKVRDFKYDLRTTFARSPFSISRDDPWLALVAKHVGSAIGQDPVICGERYWTDCALLADKGIKPLLWGPKGEGLHAKEEWVDVESIKTVADALANIAADFCS